MKDEHTNGKKMARNGRNTVISKGTFISNHSLVDTYNVLLLIWVCSFKNDFPPWWNRWRLSSVRIVSCINLFTQYRDGNERHTYILDPSVTEHFPLLFFLLSVLKPNYFVSRNCWSLTFSERKCALYKAKLFQEATFFIIIFT